MTFPCQCPNCKADLDVPDEFYKQPIACPSCQKLFYAFRASDFPPETSQTLTPAKKNDPGCGLIILIFVGFIILFMIIGSFLPKSSSSSESDREFRINREAERIQYERAKAVRDGLEHIEAKQRANRY